MYRLHLILITALSIILLTPPLAYAAAGDPTLLVNTEAMQIIDDLDSTADIVLQFGNTINKKITYELTATQFKFDDDIHIEGYAQVSGTLSGARLHASSAFSGAGLVSCSDANDKLLWNSSTQQFECGTDTGAGSSITQSEADDRYVNQAGDTMTGNLILSNGANLTLSGILTVQQNAVINSGALIFGNILPGTTATHDLGSSAARWNDGFFNNKIHLGSASNEAELSYNTTNNELEFDPDDDGTAEVVLEDGGNVGIGTTAPETTLDVFGTVSGAALTGMGLTDCDGVRDRLQWDATSRRFRCVEDPADFTDFVDTTADTVADNNTTDYWDPATHPNIDPSSTSAEILIMVSVHVQQNNGNNGDDTIVLTIKRDIDTDPTCTSTEVGPELGGMLSQGNSDETFTAIFVDTPASTGNVRYTVCSDSDSASIGGDTVQEIHFTLRETNASVIAGGSGGATTVDLQVAYDNDADGGDAVINLSSADDSIEIDNPTTSGTDSPYLFLVDQHDAGNVDGVRIQQAGIGNSLLLDQNGNGTALAIQSEAANNVALNIDAEGTAAAALQIDIAGDSDSPHLSFGQNGTFDVNLYRSMVDILRTDDAFHVGGNLSGASLTIGNAKECDSLTTDVSGNVQCGGSGAYISISTDETSNGSTALYDLFEDANYPGGDLGFTTQASNNFTFTASNGRFTATNTGTYLINFSLMARTDTSGTNADIIVRVNGSDVYLHSTRMPNAAEPHTRALSLVRELNANDFVEFLIDTTSGGDSISADGTTVSITSILGGQAGGGGGGLSEAEGDTRYVNETGDTMEGQLTINSALALSVSGAAIFNDSGYNHDVRMEGDTNQNLFFLDASTDRVGIGTAAPGYTLEVNGSFSGSTIAGAGLTDCDTASSRLQWDATTEMFSCQAAPDVASFTDTTADTIVDNNTTNYWDGTFPNLTPSSTANEILVMATVSWTQGNGGDDSVVFNIQRDIDADPGCPDTAVGPEFGAMNSNTVADNSQTVVFVDAPASTGNVRYTLCSDSDSVSLGAGNQVQRIDFSLYEINDSADLAEIYPTTDTTLTVGDVVSIDPHLVNGVTKSAQPNDSAVMGVVSTDPAQLIGSVGNTKLSGVPVAIAGRVPVHVSLESGEIEPGDYLTSASMPGVAMKATRPGPVIGRALQDYDSEGIGSIMMFVEPFYYVPRVSGADAKALKAENQELRALIKNLENRLDTLLLPK